MDTFLIDYLKSGKAWVLVGSGPSIQAGYPSWQQLATVALETARAEGPPGGMHAADAAFKRSDFPRVFEEIVTLIGSQRLRQVLQESLTVAQPGSLYSLMARWPVDVYLTTNFDDEIQQSLARVSVAYMPYSNSRDHLGHLTPDLRGAIVKLHGDLRSDDGLILTNTQYEAIRSGPEWQYWRDRMMAVFQMTRLVVIGHSLTDPHISHLLQAAKQGATVVRPICWLAPDVAPSVAREYLEAYRIRVISYDNADGRHAALVRLLRQVNQFVPARESVRIRRDVAEVSTSPLGRNAGAPGFFVFNKLSLQGDYEARRLNIALVAVETAADVLRSKRDFSVEEALGLAGWPAESMPGTDFLNSLKTEGLSRGLLEARGERFRLGPKVQAMAADNRARFEEMRERFKQSVGLRLARLYPTLTPTNRHDIAEDVDSSLSGFFREGGLTLATTLLVGDSRRAGGKLPSSIIGFMSEASNRYPDLLRRQAFCDVALELFAEPEVAEKEYLGRVSQGYFAFHALGVFGDVAINRLNEAKHTVWLVDSHIQIPALAIGSPLSRVFRATLERLKASGVRLFTTLSLFEETREHLWFASRVISEAGPRSTDVLLAAGGEIPYRKSNQFLQGFLKWQAAGGIPDWEAYLFEAFGDRRPSRAEIEAALLGLGVEVIELQTWPGFEANDFAARDEYVDKIASLRERTLASSRAAADRDDALRKALPEAEALLVSKKEREGAYHVLEVDRSPAWFITDTGMLNRIEPGLRFTWQPEAFIRFASTLTAGQQGLSADNAFDAILWAIAKSGLNMVDEAAVETIFGGIVDQAEITLIEQQQLYHETLETKYGAIDTVLGSVPPKDRPLAAIQLLREMLQHQEEAAKASRAMAAVQRKRADKAEQSLRQVEKFRAKQQAKKKDALRKNRKNLSKKKSRRRR